MRGKGEGEDLSVQLHESIGVAAKPEPRRLPRVRISGQRLATAGRLGLIFLPAFMLSLGQFGTIVHALAASAAITVAWYASIQSFRSACRPAQAALGQAGSTGMASLAGVFAVSALALWVPWLSIRPLTVVQVAAAVFVLQLAWERLVRASAAERRRVLVIGAHDGGEELVEELWMNGGRRYELVGFVDDDAAEAVTGIPCSAALPSCR